ncbi:MAG: site-specific integrase [Rhodoferax sp.]|jgi:integrase|nr:site-specific integrase [Rhodoferax sp.]
MKPTRVHLTAGRVEDFTCPVDKAQAFLWDTDTPTLALRVTPTGRKTYIFEARLKGSTIRINIGTKADWPIEMARTKAQGLKVLIDSGTDPRELERQQQADKDQAIADKAAADAAQVQQDAAQAVTVGEVWQQYIEARKGRWGALHLADHIRLSAAGGVQRKRGEGLTIPGPLYPLMTMRLVDLSASTVTAWAEREAQTRPTPARLSWRLLRAFLTWCAEQPQYAPLVAGTNAAKNRNTREALGKPGAKQDALQREQLPAWFAAVQQTTNPAIAAYLQCLLMTGARPGELLALRWTDVNMAWRGLTIHDKVEGERVIPLTSFVHHLIAGLPKRGEWIFAGAGDQALTRPAKNLNTACTVAGVDHVSLHGLRRSFKSLTEWLEIPAGVVAQLMGHKPSATAEKHYTVRPLDLLRVHHEKIEAWILDQAGVQFDRTAEPGKLRAVAG